MAWHLGFSFSPCPHCCLVSPVGMPFGGSRTRMPLSSYRRGPQFNRISRRC
uniref:Uncharacterized protein n=1 Tax=Arundo donax TaxID=35708 RepID=A0A0A9C7T5_ARUDO